MNDIEPTVTEVMARLEDAADPERRAYAEGYYPTALRVIGVKVPDIRLVVRDLAKRHRRAPAGEVIALAEALVATGSLEARQVAYELLDRHKAAREALDLATVRRLGRGLDNWVSVDVFAGLVAGPTWRAGRIPDAVVGEWARSDDRWWRRAAVVCTVALNQKARGGTGDPERTLEVCELVAADRDDMVAKALSWALRELAKREREPVRAFLDAHADTLPARVKREVRRKLETGRK